MHFMYLIHFSVETGHRDKQCGKLNDLVNHPVLHITEHDIVVTLQGNVTRLRLI